MLSRAQAEAMFHAGLDTVVRVLQELSARSHALVQQVQELVQQVQQLSGRLEVSEQRVKELEDQLAKNSCARRSESEPKRRSVLDPPRQCRRSVTEAAVNGEGVRGRGEIACG